MKCVQIIKKSFTKSSKLIILKEVQNHQIVNIRSLLASRARGPGNVKILHSKRFLCIPPLALIIRSGLWAVSWIESLSIIVLSITGDRTSLKKLLWSLSPVMPMLFPRPNTNFWAIFFGRFLAGFYDQF